MAKTIQAFETDDGQHHSSMTNAVEHEIVLLFNSWGEDLSPRKIAEIMAHNMSHRTDLQAILEQLK